MGPGGGEPGQLSQGAVTALLLGSIQQADAQHETQQHYAVGGVADQQIDQGATKQQQISGFE